MEVKTLKGIDKKGILKVFNESFSDYFIPFKLTEEQLTSKMVADKINLELSVGSFENGKLNAFILHGFDTINNQKVIYNGGTGVIPEKRGLGLTKQMYLFILPLLEKKGVNKVILEVISKNIQAIKSYEKSGFKALRELDCFKGNFNFQKINKDVEIKKLPNYQWKLMESFWDVRPTWQNSTNVMDELKPGNISLGAFIKNELVGYVIYNPFGKRIQQIATDKGHRQKGIAAALISELTKNYGQTFSVINVDKMSESTGKFFKSIGFGNYLEQLEMELIINNNYS